ncbi:hypothetical protein A3K86_19575 [Photobacterium jeanii]|uniref:Uncharacterized protein n=1 Tax=Photobacterium jeanii TaxID=858640 RepID=A0A178K360_9GAMM|nr:PD-(D/E)XK nuclease family protein [Photobacterium jeanii]OAN11164.1 hypothetical protein A3K86_19575 [Photobacterium jeanii]PST90683.1 hypothetical protein C9I91_08675 [Photobacterium jeanii]
MDEQEVSFTAMSHYFAALSEITETQAQRATSDEQSQLADYYSQVGQSFPVEGGLDPISNDEFCFHYQVYMSQVEKLYQQDYQQGCEINVWAISGLKRDEVRNTAVLSWWLDAKESHGLGERLLAQVINDHLPVINSENLYREPYTVRAESLPLAELQDRIDIEISSAQLLMFWEVKIDAPEGKNQLSRYAKLLETKRRMLSPNGSHALIYLTCKQSASQGDDESSGAYCLSWAQLRQSFLTVCQTLPIHSQSQQLLNQYCQFIKRF